jgi:hypothetical protein
MDSIRSRLVAAALEWQSRFGVAPAITSQLSELDAALLVGVPESAYAEYMRDKTAVARGTDFEWSGVRYQVKANRPSGKPGSIVTLVARPKNHQWDRLIWIHYTTQYEIHEAWQWERESFRATLGSRQRLSPEDLRGGVRLA